jgi:hypothetical protein
MNDTEDLSGKVSEWIEGQGYPLEMTVAKTFEQNRFEVIQSEYYKDPESGDCREIDVVASVTKEIGMFWTGTICLSIHGLFGSIRRALR